MTYNELNQKIFTINFKGTIQQSKILTIMHNNYNAVYLAQNGGPPPFLGTLETTSYSRSTITSHSKNNKKIEDKFFKLYSEIEKSQ